MVEALTRHRGFTCIFFWVSCLPFSFEDYGLPFQGSGLPFFFERLGFYAFVPRFLSGGGFGFAVVV